MGRKTQIISPETWGALTETRTPPLAATEVHLAGTAAENYLQRKSSSRLKVANFRFQVCDIPYREGVKKNGFIWDFVPNIGPHPPTAHVWDKVVKKTFFYNL